MSLLTENPQTPKPFALGNSIKWLLASVILSVAIVLSYFIYVALTKEQPPVPADDSAVLQAELDSLYAQEGIPAPLNQIDGDTSSPDAVRSAEELAGYLVFTALPLDKNESITNNVYYLNIKAEEPVAERFMPEFVKYSAFAEFLDLRNPAEFFMDAMYYPSLSDYGDFNPSADHGVQKYNVSTGALEAFESISGDYIQNLDWSNVAGLLAYSRQSARPEHYSDLIQIENNEVVITNTAEDTVVSVIPGAEQPDWSPDGTQLLLIRQDGLYVRDIATEAEERVVPVADGKLLATTMIDLSPDGRMLAWTQPKSGMVVMYEISSWRPFEIREVQRLQTEGVEYYWPQFSPDSKYIVVQAIDEAQPGERVRQNPRFEVRAVRGSEILFSFDLSQFDFNSFFTDAWIAQLPSDVVPQE